MVCKVDWTLRAVRDLRTIHDYIAIDSNRYARIQIERIRGAVKNLRQFPFMGRELPELPSSVYKELIVGNYRTIYSVDEDGQRVYIMAVIHARREITDTTIGQ